MEKTVSVGLVENSKINYVIFNLSSVYDIELFCDNLASYIIDKYTNNLLVFIINKNYAYLSKADKTEVYKSAQNHFSKICSEILPYQKSYIARSLYEYFVKEGFEAIVVEGFVRFRLRDYVEELEFLIDRAADELFIKLEYEHFIKMLHEFISTQKPKIRLVHIKIQDGGRYCVCGENFEELQTSCIFRHAEEFKHETVTEDDLLLSSLINLAPRKIIIHNKERATNTELFKTIDILFGSKVSICNGCEECK